MGPPSTVFQAGNVAAVKHGSRSPRLQLVKRQRIGKQIRRELKANSRAWLDRLILALEARVSSYHEYLDRVGGPLSYRGMPRRCLEMCQRDEQRLVQLYALREGRRLDDGPTDELTRLLEGDQRA